MEHLLLIYFKDKPGLIQAYHRLKPVLANIIVLCSVCVSILARTESMRSFSLGLAAGIVMINIGQGISSLRNEGSK
jgi:hypothetical protein